MTTRIVALPVSVLAVRHWLQMDDLDIAGVSVDQARSTVTFYVKRTDVPEGATEMAPVYTNEGHAPPVRLQEIQWYGEHGARITP